jgi:hypothetical protein
MVEKEEVVQARLEAIERKLSVLSTDNDQLSKLQEFKEMMGVVYDNIAAAMRAGPFMFVTYRVENGRLLCDVHNHGIIEGDFGNVVKNLQRALDGEEGDEDETPLPRAQPLRAKPLDIMVGRKSEEKQQA